MLKLNISAFCFGQTSKVNAQNIKIVMLTFQYKFLNY